jgi:hypothetical protein
VYSRRAVAAVDRKREEIVLRFQAAFLQRHERPLTYVVDGLHRNLYETLDETLGDAPIDFFESFGKAGDDDYGAVLILSGDRLYVIRVGDTQIQVTVLGELPGGRYSETMKREDAEIVETTIEYEYEDPRLPGNRLTFSFQQREANRYAPIRKLLREWGAGAGDEHPGHSSA